MSLDSPLFPPIAGLDLDPSRSGIGRIKPVSPVLSKEAQLALLEAFLAQAGSSTAPPELAKALYDLRLQPVKMAEVLSRDLPAFPFPQASLPKPVFLTGPLEGRVIGVEQVPGHGLFLHLGEEPLGDLPWPAPILAGLSFGHPRARISEALLAPEARFRLLEPHVKLVALYHSETFPLPRFPLGISDIARAVRCRLQGRVSLCDMQLGLAVEDVIAEIHRDLPGVLGISATFGQNDLLVHVLDRILPRSLGGPLIVVGGSLGALNACWLLERYPEILIARGAGEETMVDVVSYTHGDLGLADIRGIWYRDGVPVSTARIDNRRTSRFIPELDLLVETLRHGGVMQLESSRGCTHACSFCPRDHKGSWFGDEAENLRTIISEVGAIYDRFPDRSRKLFLVDEEFVGRSAADVSLRRAEEVALSLQAQGFKWETSARIDQICRPDRDGEWHTQRIRFWRRLCALGLDRCLFGIESGVDSVLERFHKQVTCWQNVLGLRLLTACGVPIRCTYITFDPLMTMDELRATYAFLGRTDLLLKPAPELGPEEVFRAVGDEGFVLSRTAGTPFYSQVSYMLVSMECLIGSAYTRQVEAAGLAREALPTMGRKNADFKDPAIGILSESAQRWVDRNFAFDYALKSLEKLSLGEERGAYRGLRRIFKKAAFDLLGAMLDLPEAQQASRSGPRLLDGVASAARALLDRKLFALQSEIQAALHVAACRAKPERQAILLGNAEKWFKPTSWELINED